MAEVTAIRGVQQVLNNLRRQHKRMAAGVERGIKLAALHLQRESQKLVPVEYGPLKASAFTRADGKGFKTLANVGYTSGYALYVHENVEMKLRGQDRTSGIGQYWDPRGRGQSKFLEQPARTEAKTMREIIKENARIK